MIDDLKDSQLCLTSSIIDHHSSIETALCVLCDLLFNVLKND